MLTAYETQTRRLLQNPSAPTALYSTTDIDSWVNTARGQLAGESKAIRFLGTLTTTPGTNNYAFTAINTGVSATNGIQGVLHVRSIRYAVGAGTAWFRPRPWEWFELYHLNNPVPDTGQPQAWAQYGQGANGTFFIDPIPDIAYTLTLDCVCYPIDLVNNTTVEAIPYLWTDCVPFLAAWYALLSAQMQARRADAEAYYNYYSTFLQRAREAANPDVLKYMYQQANDPASLSKLGLQKAANA